MQLEPGERSVLAYFPSTESAQRAAGELKSMGYNTVQVDRISRYGVENNSAINSAISGTESLSSLTIFSSDAADFSDINDRILRGSDPSVSGYGDAGYGVAGGKAFLVTVVTDQEGGDQAVRILEKHGGKI